MRKLLTRAIAAGVLLAVFSVYGDTSNLVFYSDFEKATDGQTILLSADLNGATFAPPSLYDQTGFWTINSLGNNSASTFRAGVGDNMIAFLDLRTGGTPGNVSGTLSTPTLFSGSEAIRFSYNFKPNSGGKGVAHLITGYDSKNSQVFAIRMGGPASATIGQVTVNGTPIGTVPMSSIATDPLNSISLVLDSTGINVEFINGTTLVKTTGQVAAQGGINFAKFVITTDVTCKFDYDNFQVWAIARVPPPPRLDLYMLISSP